MDAHTITTIREAADYLDSIASDQDERHAANLRALLPKPRYEVDDDGDIRDTKMIGWVARHPRPRPSKAYLRHLQRGERR